MQHETDRLDLTWSAWMPLMAAHPLALAQLPSQPGLLRVRRVGLSGPPVWIGWVPDGVRQTAERLSRQVHLPVIPFDDPSVPARALWVAKREEGAAFEISGAVPSDDALTPEAWTQLLEKGAQKGCLAT